MGNSFKSLILDDHSEAEGLKALDDTHTIRVPTPYAYGVLEGESCGYLATEVRIVFNDTRMDMFLIMFSVYSYGRKTYSRYPTQVWRAIG